MYFSYLEATFLLYSIVHHVDAASEGMLLMSITDSLVGFFKGFSTINYFNCQYTGPMFMFNQRLHDSYNLQNRSWNSGTYLLKSFFSTWKSLLSLDIQILLWSPIIHFGFIGHMCLSGVLPCGIKYQQNHGCLKYLQH